MLRAKGFEYQGASSCVPSISISKIGLHMTFGDLKCSCISQDVCALMTYHVYHCICEWKCLPSRWPHPWGWYHRPHILNEPGCGVCPPQYCDQVASLYIQDASEWVLGELVQQEPRELWLYCCLRWTIQCESQIAFPP